MRASTFDSFLRGRQAQDFAVEIRKCGSMTYADISDASFLQCTVQKGLVVCIQSRGALIHQHKPWFCEKDPALVVNCQQLAKNKVWWSNCSQWYFKTPSEVCSCTMLQLILYTILHMQHNSHNVTWHTMKLENLLCFSNEEDHKIARYVAKSILWCLEGCSEKETCLANASLCCSPSERMPLQSAKWSRPLPGLLPLEVLPLSSSKPSLTCRNTLSKSLSLGSGFWLLLPFLWGRLMWINQDLCTLMLSAFSSAVSNRHSSQEKYNGTATCTWVRNTWFSHIYASALRIRCNAPVLHHIVMVNEASYTFLH